VKEKRALAESPRLIWVPILVWIVEGKGKFLEQQIFNQYCEIPQLK